MKASWYAESLYSALQGIEKDGDSKKVFTHFHKVVSARGHEKLLPFIGHELEKILEREKNNSEVILITADNKSISKWAHAYDHYEKEKIIPRNAIRRDVVDESIVGGFQIKTRDLLIDASYKKSLVDLYRSITTN